MTSLALYQDLLGPGESLSLPRGIRVLYVASGEVSSLQASEAWLGTGEAELEAGGEGATLLRWELTEWEPGAANVATAVDLDPWAEHVVRCARVVAEVGESVLLGPGQGIACLLHGELRVGGELFGPLGAWVEPAGEGEAEMPATALVRVSLADGEDEAAGGEVLARERVRL